MLWGYTFSSNVHAQKDYRLVKTQQASEVFLVKNNRRIHIPNPYVFEAGGYAWEDIQTISQNEMDGIINTALIKSPVDAKVYLIKNGQKSWIPNEDSFLSAGLLWDDIVLISQPQVDFYPDFGFSSLDAKQISRNISESVVKKSTPVLSSPVVAPTVLTYTQPKTKATILDLGIMEPNASMSGSINNSGNIAGLRETKNWMITREDGGTQRRYDWESYLWSNGVFSMQNDKSRFSDINNNGDMVGYVYTPTGSGYSAVYQDGKEIRLGTFGGSYTSISDINNLGQVIGVSEYPVAIGEDSGKERPFLWENGQMKEIVSPVGEIASFGAMNDHGQMIGSSRVAGAYDWHAITVDNGVVHDLGDSQLKDINNSGQIVGYKSAHPYTWENFVPKKLPIIAGRSGGMANAINAHGDIVGRIYEEEPELDHRLFEEYQYEVLTAAYASQATLWRNGDFIVLSNLFADEGYILSDAYAINDRGEILVRGTDKNKKDFHIYRIQLPENIPPQLHFTEMVLDVDTEDGDNIDASNTFLIEWQDADPDDNARISLYYNRHVEPGDSHLKETGELIVTDLREDEVDSYLWNVSNVSSGLYHVYAMIDDGVHVPVRANSNQWISKNMNGNQSTLRRGSVVPIEQID
jgi:probable HAF family extracellular repeat protein